MKATPISLILDHLLGRRSPLAEEVLRMGEQIKRENEILSRGTREASALTAQQAAGGNHGN